jgi:polysaccharide biosynthesis/export protein
MTVGNLPAHSRSRVVVALGCLALAFGFGSGSGCSALNAHHAAKIPHPGVIDPNQPRELQMVSMPPYVVEPPDELEVSVRPVVGDLSAKSIVVQADGNLDLGFAGDVYVAGLTLEQIERKIVQQLTTRGDGKEKYEASVRLVNGTQSKYYYVIGTVTNQGRFPLKGNETVLEAILAAGLKVNSVPEKACLVRPHPAGGPDTVLKIDWIAIRERGDTLTNYQVFPGDRILIPGVKPPGLLSTLFGG